MFSLLGASLSFLINGISNVQGQKLIEEQTKKSNVPIRLWTDNMEKSFSAQLQTTVRAPFGPNPLEHHINDFGMLKSPEYQASYQKNLGSVTIWTPDWRIDPIYNSDLNNYSSFTMPEATPEQIQNFNQTIFETRGSY